MDTKEPPAAIRSTRPNKLPECDIELAVLVAAAAAVDDDADAPLLVVLVVVPLFVFGIVLPVPPAVPLVCANAFDNLEVRFALLLVPRRRDRYGARLPSAICCSVVFKRGVNPSSTDEEEEVGGGAAAPPLANNNAPSPNDK